MFKKIRDAFRKEQAQPDVLKEAEDRLQSIDKGLSSISESQETIGIGKVFHLREGGVSTTELIEKIGPGVPWGALSTNGEYIVALPVPVAVITLVMSVSHDNVLCSEVNAMADAVGQVIQRDENDIIYKVYEQMEEVYKAIGHAERGYGAFGFRDSNPDDKSMIYGFLSRNQLVEMNLSVQYMHKTKPDFTSEGFSAMVDITASFWRDLASTVPPEAVMETMGSGYTGNA